VRIEEPKVGDPTDQSDVIIGSNAGEILTGVPQGSTLHGKGSIDRLTGNGGQDVFALGSVGQRFYESDGSSGLVVITDFTMGQDRIQLSGAPNQYTLSSGRFNSISGTFISVLSSGDRLGFVENVRLTGSTPLLLTDHQQFLYV
jgi:Ca2+-binding RTX toxin-like protein